MRLFSKYSRKNCLEECQSNLSLSTCGCVDFFLASKIHMDSFILIVTYFFSGDETTRICGLSDSRCSYDNMLLFIMEPVEPEDVKKCDCLQECNSIEYEIQVIKTKLEFERHYLTYNNVSYWIGNTYHGALTVSFSDTEYTALRRYQSNGIVSFLSNVGGLLSLFLGVSVISIIEIFYFLFIRLTTDLMKPFLKKKEIRKIHQTDLSNALYEINL